MGYVDFIKIEKSIAADPRLFMAMIKHEYGAEMCDRVENK